MLCTLLRAFGVTSQVFERSWEVGRLRMSLMAASTWSFGEVKGAAFVFLIAGCIEDFQVR